MKRILIVDDDPDVRATLHHQLRSLGYKVCGEAANVDQALAMFASLVPQVVIMDIDLGAGINGIEAARLLGSSLNFDVVFVSGRSDLATISEAVGTRAFGYLSKPYKSQDLFAAIETASLRSEMETQLRARDRSIAFIEGVAKIGSWEIDGDGKFLTYSSATAELLGIQSDRGRLSLAEFARFIDRADRLRFVEWITQWIGGPLRVLVIGSDQHSRTMVFHREARSSDERSAESVAGLVQEAKESKSASVEAIATQLTTGIAHDFNNLLAVIQGNAELIAGGTQAWRNEITAVLRATSRAAEVTNWLLSYSQRQTLDPKPVDLADFVMRSKAMLARIVPETVEINFHFAADKPVVLADQALLQTAFLNVVVNARDAMAEGGTMDISIGTQVKSASEWSGAPDSPSGRLGYISISDSGRGIDPSILPKVREPYFTTKPVGQGIGLGLSMVEGFVRQSGGYLSIESTPDIGTTVALYFPITAEVATFETSAEGAEIIPRGCGERIFLIEDDPDVNEFLIKMIEGLGYHVTSVSSGDEALNRPADLQLAKLIVSDVVLPGQFNGPELIDKIREQHPDVKAVLISGYPRIASTRGALPGKADGFMSKPFTRAKLAALLREVLARP